MYEEYTRQSLPSKRYRELLGSAVCVFNSNNAFIIENILRKNSVNYSWHSLIDERSSKLVKIVREIIVETSDIQIADLFEKIINKRNRIVHSFQITDVKGEQILATKDNNNAQFIITEDYLLGFIKNKESL